MEVDELQRQIKDTFRSVERSRTSLRQFRLTDLKGMTGSISDIEWLEASRSRIDKTWADIPDSEIEECECQLAHMEPEDFTYYLPAYMSYSLRKMEIENTPQDILSSTVFSLSPSKKETSSYKYSLNQLSILNIEQQNAVIDFLEFVSVNANEFEQPYARKTLDRYWYARKNN